MGKVTKRLSQPVRGQERWSQPGLMGPPYALLSFLRTGFPSSYSYRVHGACHTIFCVHRQMIMKKVKSKLWVGLCRS